MEKKYIYIYILYKRRSITCYRQKEKSERPIHRFSSSSFLVNSSTPARARSLRSFNGKFHARSCFVGCQNVNNNNKCQPSARHARLFWPAARDTFCGYWSSRFFAFAIIKDRKIRQCFAQKTLIIRETLVRNGKLVTRVLTSR